MKGTGGLKGTVPFSSDENRDSPRDENRDSPRDENRDSPRKLQVPADFAGFYQIKVTPETSPWQSGAAAAEYKVQTLVEVRTAGARGSAAAATALNRAWFAAGEEIPLVLYTRGIAAAKGTELRITFGYDPQGLGAKGGNRERARRLTPSRWARPASTRPSRSCVSRCPNRSAPACGRADIGWA